MPIKTVNLATIIEDDVSSAAAIDYAIAFCDVERAHLSCRIAAPLLDLTTARLLPLAQALVDQVNAERLAKANETRGRIETAARISGVPLDCRIVQKPFTAARIDLAAATRASDFVILPQAKGGLSAETGVIESILFEAGRPVIVVPSDWSKGPTFKRIVIAWDGGARAARAVGDAMPILARADEVEVVCVVDDGGPSAAGSELAEHLARHCRAIRLTDLPLEHADAGLTLRAHLDGRRPDLLVMGAYAHSRLWQFVLGGMTKFMMSAANVPVLYSY